MAHLRKGGKLVSVRRKKTKITATKRKKKGKEPLKGLRKGLRYRREKARWMEEGDSLSALQRPLWKGVGHQLRGRRERRVLSSRKKRAYHKKGFSPARGGDRLPVCRKKKEMKATF